MLPRCHQIVLAVALLALVRCTSAAARSKTELDELRRTIELAVMPKLESVPSGADLELTLTLRNTSDRRVTLCLGSGLVVNFWGLSEAYARGSMISAPGDHAFCERQLSLSPREKTTWSATIPKLSLPTGTARLFVSQQIVSLANCDRYGCDYEWLNGQFEPLHITE